MKLYILPICYFRRRRSTIVQYCTYIENIDTKRSDLLETKIVNENLFQPDKLECLEDFHTKKCVRLYFQMIIFGPN
jgi:hypothetical protein